MLLGEEVVGHLVSHSSKTDEACGARPNKSSVSGLQTSQSGPHVQVLGELDPDSCRSSVIASIASRVV